MLLSCMCTYLKKQLCMAKDSTSRHRFCTGLRQLLQTPPQSRKRVVAPSSAGIIHGRACAHLWAHICPCLSAGVSDLPAEAASLHADVIDLLKPRWILDTESATLWRKVAEAEEGLKFCMRSLFPASQQFPGRGLDSAVSSTNTWQALRDEHGLLDRAGDGRCATVERSLASCMDLGLCNVATCV